MVLGLEFFEAGFGLGGLGAEFLLSFFGSSLGKSPRARSTGFLPTHSSDLISGPNSNAPWREAR